MSSVDVTTESILDARAEQPFAFADEKERAIAVRFAVSTLDSKYREVVVLRDMEGFSYDEVAGILGVPVGTVRSRLYRARNILRDELGPQLED